MSERSDFNDLHVKKGLQAVKDQLQSAVDDFLAKGVEGSQSPAPSVSDGRGINDPSAPPIGDEVPLEVYGDDCKTARKEGSHPPSLLEVSAELTLDDALKRFAVISGKTQIWDSYDRERLSAPAFTLKVGGKIAKAWRAVNGKRLVREEDVRQLLAEAQAAKKGGGGVGEALARFIYLEVSDTAWDSHRREVVRLSDIKHTIPQEFEFWYRHPKRKVIDKNNLVFDPTQNCDPTTHINMFQGLPLKPDFDADKCRSIRAMLWQLCNYDNEVWDWLTKWLAYPLQHVGSKLDTALLIHSDVHGSGKSLFFDQVMRPIYGRYGATLGQHQIESQYTDWQSNLMYGVFEEIFSREKKYSQTGNIKQMITSPTTRIEKKFVSGWEEASYCNCVFCSNEIQPFPVEPSDRRFLVVWPRHVMSKKAEDSVEKELQNGGSAALLGWLLRLDLGDFNRRTKPPATDAKRRLISFGLPSWEVFFAEWSSGEVDAPYHTCLTGDLYEVYRRWCRANGFHQMDKNRFSECLSVRVTKRSKLTYDNPGGFGKSPKKSMNGTFFLLHKKPTDKEQKAWLSECVNNFRREIGAFEESLP